MPKFAHLAERTPCPKCGANLAYNDRIGFQWGYCPYAYSDSDRESYHFGDAILWRLTVDGRVPAWRYFHDGTANIGNPRDSEVVIREIEFEIDHCAGCGWRFGGIGVIVRGGRIEATRVFQTWPSGVDVFTVGPGGELVPPPDWTDRAMGTGANGGPSPRLLTTPEAQAITEDD